MQITIKLPHVGTLELAKVDLRSTTSSSLAQMMIAGGGGQATELDTASAREVAALILAELQV